MKYLNNQHIFSSARMAVAGLCLAFMSSVASASVISTNYHVHLNSSGLSGTGWLDLQFNPGNDFAVGATATVRNFAGPLDASQSPQLSGDVSGSLPASVTFDNGSAYNDLFQAISLGSALDFDLTFTGDFLSHAGSVGTSFALSLYGDDQLSLLGNYDPNSGSLMKIDLTPPSSQGAAAAIDVIVSDAIAVQVQVIPEPGSVALWAAGLLLVVATSRRGMKS